MAAPDPHPLIRQPGHQCPALFAARSQRLPSNGTNSGMGALDEERTRHQRSRHTGQVRRCPGATEAIPYYPNSTPLRSRFVPHVAWRSTINRKNKNGSLATRVRRLLCALGMVLGWMWTFVGTIDRPWQQGRLPDLNRTELQGCRGTFATGLLVLWERCTCFSGRQTKPAPFCIESTLILLGGARKPRKLGWLLLDSGAPALRPFPGETWALQVVVFDASPDLIPAH